MIRLIRHAVSRELVEPSQKVDLEAIDPLKRGEAPNRPIRGGGKDDVVIATLPHLTPTFAAMVRVQRSAAMDRLAAVR